MQNFRINRPWVMDRSETMDDPPRDPRAENMLQGLAEKDFQGHRAHSEFHNSGPMRSNSHHHGHRSHRRHHRHHRRNSEVDNEDRPATPPSQRVQFILGEEDLEGSSSEPHPLFSEMETLTEVEGEFEWKETARWVRFEEDVEEGGNRWSKPHVGTLSLHSLFELRALLLNGTLMLDMEAHTLDDIADLLLDNLINAGVVTYDKRQQFRDILLLKHKHLHCKTRRHRDDSHSGVSRLPLIRSLAEIGRSYSSARGAGTSSSALNGDHSNGNGNNASASAVAAGAAVSFSSAGGSSSIDMQISPSGVSLPETNGSTADFAKRNLHFMRKLPAGSESSNILVGEVDFLERPVSVFIRLSQACLLGDMTEVPVPTRFIFLLLGPPGGLSRYHEIGRAMATLLSDEVFHIVAYKAKNRGHLLAATDEFLDAVTVLPPGEWDPDIRIEPPAAVPSQDQRKRPNKDEDEDKGDHDELDDEKYRIESGLVRTGRLFGGLINDFKRKRAWYVSDFKDALALQSLASYIFLYFACLTPIVAFGGLLGEATKHHMGAIESLVSGLISGVIYGFCSGQPLNILGSTGPVLVFEGIMFNLCEQWKLEYLSVRLWIGLWIMLFLLVLVALDASAYVCYITRFTEENFATLIAFIFIVKAIQKVVQIKDDQKHYHVLADYDCYCRNNSTNGTTAVNWSEVKSAELCVYKYHGQLNGTACPDPIDVYTTYHSLDRTLMSMLLFIFTFFIAVNLKNFKFSTFFPNKVRHFISDFSVIIAIVLMTCVDMLVGIDTPKLNVPSTLVPTLPNRPWVVQPFVAANPWWTCLVAAVPALLGVILIFMDQQITAVIVNRKEHRLKKGGGYHLDLFVLAILIGINSVLGLPWFVAATVLAINHVNSLKLESQCAAPGEKPQFLGVRENRVTHIMIFITIGLSVLMTPVLKLIPMAVLFGVFLYMGVSALKGLQFFDRILIMFMPVKYQPDYSFLRQVPLKRVHIFTLIQLACLVLLWVIKSFQQTSILFPVMLVVMVGIRWSLGRVFTARELKILDDPMPEFSKKKPQDKEKLNSDKDDSASGHLPLNESGNITIPLASGNVMRIPRGSINISEEMDRSALWKGINCENGGVNKTHGSFKKRPRKSVHNDATQSLLKTTAGGAGGGASTTGATGSRLSSMPEEEDSAATAAAAATNDCGITICINAGKYQSESAAATKKNSAAGNVIKAKQTSIGEPV